MNNKETNQKTVNNRTMFCGDNLDVIYGLNSNSIDLIYLDPPFNKKNIFSAPIGSKAEGASFDDIWGEEDIKDSWLLLIKEKYLDMYNFLNMSNIIGDKSNKYYLIYMAARLLEFKRVLKDTGSIYLHCDQTMSHYLKLLMDIIFGHKNFRNEIVWHYLDTPGRSNRYFPKKHDTLFWYSKIKDYYFNDKLIRVPILDASKKRYKTSRKIGGREYIGGEAAKIGKIPEDVWKFPAVKGNSLERVGYPTQKPLALLERIINASCPDDGVILDPFCGCATTLIAGEKLNKRWIGIDVSDMAYKLVKDRLNKEVATKDELFTKELYFREDIPFRTDIENKKLTGIYKKEIKQELYGKQFGNCNGCKNHFLMQVMEVDHIIPKSKGGGDNKDNLQLLCSYCNRVKGDKSMAELIRKLKDLE